MVKVTNNRKAGHTIFVKSGPVEIRPGETKEVSLNDAEIKDIRAAGLEIAKPAPKVKLTAKHKDAS